MKKFTSLLCLLLSTTIFTISATAQVTAPGIQFSKTLGGSHDDIGERLIQTRDKGYLVAGYTNSTDGDITNPGVDTTANMYDILLIKTDSVGNKIWDRVLKGVGTDYMRNVVETDNAYIVFGQGISTTYDFSTMPTGSNYYAFMFWLSKDDGHIMYSKGYGGNGVMPDIYDVLPIGNNAMMITGNFFTLNAFPAGYHGQGDVWIAKITADSGNIIWQKYWGGSDGEVGNAIIKNKTGGYVVAGNSWSADGDITTPGYGANDGLVLSIDSVGNTEWYKLYGTTNGETFQGVGGVADGYIMGGNSNGNGQFVHGSHGDMDYWLVKINNTGDTVWTRTYGGSLQDRLFNITTTNDGGAIMNGYIVSTDGTFAKANALVDNGLLRIDQNGNEVWAKRMGSNLADNVGAVITTCDNGYAFTALASQVSGDVTGTDHGNFEMWLCKLNSDGLDNITLDAPCNQTTPIDTSSSVAKISHLGNISIYPNPAAQNVTVDFHRPLNGLRLQMINTLGQTVWQQQADNTVSSVSIELKNWPAGVYVLTVTDGVVSKQFIVSHPY